MSALRKPFATLDRRRHLLASGQAQRTALDDLTVPSFASVVAEAGLLPLATTGARILQMNLGKRCNQTCRHCHVDAGPDRQEVMTDAVLEACLDLVARTEVETVDITGGAPELHPRFRELVTRVRALGREVIDRCNLTITRLPNYADLPDFLAANHVHVIASLPALGSGQTDAQRGIGVYEESIAALRHFNRVGYAQPDSGLALDLVTNPVGAFLPGNQASLEREWKRELGRRHGIAFDRLYTITNMPISRFLEFLIDSGNLEGYLERLIGAFNPAAVAGLMCRFTLSVGWDGRLYDCDFNQMLELALSRTIFDITPEELLERAILVGPHCYGCTAGAGSSCGGSTT